MFSLIEVVFANGVVLYYSQYDQKTNEWSPWEPVKRFDSSENWRELPIVPDATTPVVSVAASEVK